jgi:hypothetical protein
MQYLPSSFSKILKNKKTTQTDLPQHSSQFSSQVTLFDNLPPAERKAAIEKLQDLADQQPGQKSHRPRRFGWKVCIMAFGITSLLVLAIVALVYAVDKDSNPELAQKLRMANTNLDRMALLPDNDDWLFDFTKQDKYTFSPGGVINANAATFPATIGMGMTLVSLLASARTNK